MDINKTIDCNIRTLLINKGSVIINSVVLREIDNNERSANNNYFKPTGNLITSYVHKTAIDLNNSWPIKNGHHTSPIPLLSFQLMTRAEPAQMVIDTIESLLAIKADGDEILIIDNNHTNTELYEPLSRYCAGLDTRFKVRFYHVDRVDGFKSGALNLALQLMDQSCTHVVVVDSDYQALPHARTSIVAAIKRHSNHALLQFPQFYRDAGLADVHSELNHYFNHHLYRPFNRTRALSTGTYAVINKEALVSLGGWSGASITEDAQMGVLMHRQGLHSQFIPEVIATGLLPTTLYDLITQRRRWIYGNMQVLSTYFSEITQPLTSFSSKEEKAQRSNYGLENKKLSIPRTAISRLGERTAYMRAHLSQLSAWVNFTGFFIVLHLCIILTTLGALITGADIDLHSLLTPLYAVYVSYTIFLGRRLWAYCHDRAPLNQQVNKDYIFSLRRQLRTWALHLNFWELGALSWLPVLWGRDKPFICTPKQKCIQTRQSLFTDNLKALPKLLLVLNVITAVLVAPFSPLYSPVLFSCSLIICLLKLWSAQVIFANYAYISEGVSLAIIKLSTPKKPASHCPALSTTTLISENLAKENKAFTP